MLLLFILCAIRSGNDRYYLLKISENAVKGREVFYYLRPSAFFRAFVFYLNYYLRKFFNMILCFSPSVAVAVFLFYYLEEGRASLAVSVVIIACVTALAVNGIIWFYRFNAYLFLSRYYFASGKYTSYRQLFSSCARHIDGNRNVIIKEKIKFAGWFISCIFIFPVAFVQNYYRETMASVAKDLIGI